MFCNHSTAAKFLLSCLYTISQCRSLQGYLDIISQPIKSLQARQVTGVVGTTQFLRRAYQSSTVANNWIYIDGGEFSFLNNGTPSYNYSNTILSIDLNQDWTNSTVKIHSTAKPAGCVSLNEPSLWYYEPESVLYSGFAGWQPNFMVEKVGLQNISTWTFAPDGTGSGAWKNVIPSGSPALAGLNRPAQAFQAFGNDSAWVLGGFDINQPGQYPYLSSMVHFNMSSKTFQNLSAPAYVNSSGAVDNGVLHYVPSFGPQGLFIGMGGNTIQHVDGLIGFDTVAVFDPAKQEWWNQTTTGSPPTSRMEFCAAGVNSTNSTYEIFVYGGWGTALGANSVQYDTISILTLPAFHWISVPNDPQSPRIGLSCNAIGGNQILTIGGRDGNPKVTTGTHVENIMSSFDTPDPNAQGLGIFDMTKLAWSAQYVAKAPPYEQSTLVKQFYSDAQQTYGQNLTDGVAALLQVTHFATAIVPPVPSATGIPVPADHPSGRINQSAAGGISGGILFLILLISLILFLMRRRRQHRAAALHLADTKEETNTAATSDTIPIQEMDQDSARPAELDERRLFEAGDGQICELDNGDGR